MLIKINDDSMHLEIGGVITAARLGTSKWLVIESPEGQPLAEQSPLLPHNRTRKATV